MTATATPSAAVADRSRPLSGLARVRPIYLVVAETALAGALMISTLGRQSFWFDETVTAGEVHRGVRSAVRYAVDNEPMTALYLLVMKVWSVPFGDSEVALRSFSVLAAMALVPVTYALTVRLFDVRTALVAGLLTAVSTTVVAEGQQARQYAVLMLLAALATLCFVRAVEVGTQQSWLLYALVAVVAVYVQFIVGFVLAAHLLSLLALPKTKVHWRSVWIASGAFTVAVIPLVAAILRRGQGGLDWITPTSWSRLQHTLETLAGGTGYLLLAALVACAFALRTAVRVWKQSGRTIEAWRYSLLLAWLVTPVIGLLLVSLVQPLFVERYVIGALPALVILTAVGIRSMRPPQLAAGFLVALVALNGVVLVDWLGSETATAHTGVPREDWRGAVAFVLAHAGGEDAVVLQPRYLEGAWEYYFRRDGSPRDGPVLALTQSGFYEPFAGAEQVRGISERHDRVWLLVSVHHGDADDRLGVVKKFRARYDLVATHRFAGDVEVLRYDARD